MLALDVGRNQLHEHLKNDPRVTWHDGVNVRELDRDRMDFPCSLAVVDLSFISLTKVLAALVASLSREPAHPVAELVLLVKPQFEAGRSEVSKGRGVIVDPEVHRGAVETVRTCAESLGCTVESVVESPIKGAEGNTEFLMWVKCPGDSVGYGS